MNKLPFPQTHLCYGGDYNPEQWPESVCPEDMALMKQAGVNLVTLGVFSWAQLEPRPGVYTFDWLDRIIALLHENGIEICLATATASPPPWLAKHHPESLPVDVDGVTYWPGGRQAYCPHSAAYRESAAKLVRQLAERYGQHPAVKIWHINNEYGCHTDECFCDVSAQAFRDWLKARYQTIEALNAAWATSFWSQRYDDWDEINPPRRAPTFANPTQNLDWRRFSSDSLLDLLEMEKTILREVTPNIPVTTNFLGFWKTTDYWKWSKREDVISMDAYPDPAAVRLSAHDKAPLYGGGELAMQSDLMRSLGGSNPWMLMEQTTSAVNWREVNVPKRPGLMRLWSLQSVARGAGAIMFFQWRASKAGAEKFHSGMVPHVGVEKSRVWDEVVRLGADLQRLDALLATRVQAEVAILFDWESWWALELDSKPSMDIKFREQLIRHFEPLFRANLTTDFVHPSDDLSRYKLVIIPNLYLARAAGAKNIAKYVENGGTVLMSFFSGIVNEDEHIWLGGYPAPFRQMLGLMVEEFVPAMPGQTIPLKFDTSDETATDLWAEVIHLEGAEALATFTTDFFAGSPAVTRHHYGRGTAYYIGTRLGSETMSALMKRVADGAGIQPALAVPAGVEVIRRKGNGKKYVCIFNHLAAPVTVDVAGTDLLTGQPVNPVIEPLGARMVELDAHA
jgi:beta-galactosidase